MLSQTCNGFNKHCCEIKVENIYPVVSYHIVQQASNNEFVHIYRSKINNYVHIYLDVPIFEGKSTTIYVET